MSPTVYTELVLCVVLSIKKTLGPSNYTKPMYVLDYWFQIAGYWQKSQ